MIISILFVTCYEYPTTVYCERVPKLSHTYKHKITEEKRLKNWTHVKMGLDSVMISASVCVCVIEEKRDAECLPFYGSCT